MKKIICVECETIHMMHPNELKNFRCKECDCDDYKDWEFRSDKGSQDRKNQNRPFPSQQPPRPPIPQKEHPPVVDVRKAVFAELPKPPVVETKPRYESPKKELIEETQETKELVQETLVAEEEVEMEEDLSVEAPVEEEVVEENTEEYYRENLVEEFAPYITSRGLKEINIKYDYQGVDVLITLKPGELHD